MRYVLLGVTAGAGMALAFDGSTDVAALLFGAAALVTLITVAIWGN